MAKERIPLIERFWAKVQKGEPDQCWLWINSTNGAGYGMITRKRPDGTHGRSLAHRLSYEIHCGPIPDNALICHKCDNPSCVNPAHLFIGSYRDNTHDMMRKGRHNYGRPKRDNSGKLLHPPPILCGDQSPMRRYPHLVKRGEAVSSAKLTEPAVADIYRRRLAGEPVRAIARSLAMDAATIRDICAGDRWAHLLGRDGNPTLAQLQGAPKGKQQTLLTEATVREIRATFSAGATGVEVAARFGITKQTASEIKNRKTWAHLD